MASDGMSRNYEVLTGPERFALMVEAMARGDEKEADRLEGTCPQLTYRCDDAGFRDRMKRSSLIACLFCLNVRAGIAQIRMANVFLKVCDAFADWPTKAALAGMMFGRTYGHWEAGAVEELHLMNLDELTAELKENDYLREQVGELKGVVDLAMRKVAETVRYAVGEMHAADLLSQWEGFGRFCRQHLWVEPMTLLRAFGLEKTDPGEEVLASYPDARPDEAKAAEFARGWERGWVRRFR